jgi:hypothetical protein
MSNAHGKYSGRTHGGATGMYDEQFRLESLDRTVA